MPLKAVGSGFPLTMGVEAAGTVEKIGVNFTSVSKGERVAYALVGSGKWMIYFVDAIVCPWLTTSVTNHLL